jgi:hypothetical protein
MFDVLVTGDGERGIFEALKESPPARRHSFKDTSSL